MPSGVRIGKELYSRKRAGAAYDYPHCDRISAAGCSWLRAASPDVRPTSTYRLCWMAGVVTLSFDRRLSAHVGLDPLLYYRE